MVAYLGVQPKLFLTDLDGNPLAGGKIYTYEAGTTTPKATYSNYEATDSQTNPIILDSSGMATVFWDPSLYDVAVNDSNDVQLYTVPNYSPGVLNAGGSGGFAGGFGEATDTPSAATVDLGAVTSHFAVVTGTTMTSSFGSSASLDEPFYRIRVESAGWTVNLSASILAPQITGSTYTSTQNDYLDLEWLGSGVWKIWNITRGDGSISLATATFDTLTVTTTANLP